MRSTPASPLIPSAPAAPGGASTTPQPILAALIQIPAPPAAAGPVLVPAPAAPPTPPSAAALGLVPQPGVGISGYPTGVLFISPSATGASSGLAALTGATPPGNAVGLIYAVQQAIVTKTFGGQGGTTDINLPLDILPLVRFGIYGRDRLPRAEFGFEIRYLDHQGQEPPAVTRRASTTNIMYRGVGPIASTKAGHRDIRMLLPAAARDLAADVANAQLPLPQTGNYVLVEFPTIATPSFRISVLDPSSPLHAQVAALAASTPNVGHGNAWWLPAGLSPAW
jgi:hypothetical protein